jgi:hypothetical protein
MTVSIAKSDLPDDLSQWEEMEIVEEAGTPSEHADTFYRYDNYGIEEHEGGTYQAYVIVPGGDGEEPVMIASGFDSPDAVISYLKGLMGKKELTAGECGSGIVIELTGETPAFDKKSPKKDEKEYEDEECEDDKDKEDGKDDKDDKDEEDEKKKKKDDEKIEKADFESESANGSTTEQGPGAQPTQDKVAITEEKAGKVQEAPEAGVAKSARFSVADTLNTIKKACGSFQSPSGFQKKTVKNPAMDKYNNYGDYAQTRLTDRHQDWNKQSGKGDYGDQGDTNKKGKDIPPAPPKNKTATLDDFSGKDYKPSRGDANRLVSDDYGVREKDMTPSPRKGWSQATIDKELMPYIDKYYPKDASRSALPPIDSWPSRVREDYGYAVRNSGLDADLLREYLGAMLNDPRYREPETRPQLTMDSSEPQLTHDPVVEEMARYKEQHPSQLMMDSYEPQLTHSSEADMIKEMAQSNPEALKQLAYWDNLQSRGGSNYEPYPETWRSSPTQKSFKDALSSANDAKTAIKIRRHKMLKSDRVATGLKYPTTNIGTDRDASGYLAGYEVPQAENVKDDSMNSETEMKKAYYEPLPSFRKMMELKKAGLPYDVPPEADGADAPADGPMGARAPAEGAGAPAADVPPVDAGAGVPAGGAGAPGDEDVEAAAQQIADSLKQLPPEVLAKVEELLNEGGDVPPVASAEEPEEDVPPAA